nr:kinesin-like protein KIN-12F [Ipomoea batatas]
MYFNQLGWIPLVKDALAGYNTSLLAYGQTGSGKTYTLWGPPSAMVETPSTNSLQGIVPRIFQMLFDNIQRVYNDHIGDLLDPMQRNLKLLEWNGNRDCEQEIVKEIQGEVDHDDRGKCFDMAERDALPT